MFLQFLWHRSDNKEEALCGPRAPGLAKKTPRGGHEPRTTGFEVDALFQRILTIRSWKIMMMLYFDGGNSREILKLITQIRTGHRLQE